MTPNPEQPDRSEQARILRERAQALAIPIQSTGDTGLETLQFKLGRERYALENCYLNGVYPLEDLTPLPGVPGFLLGIVLLRGRVIPVFDLNVVLEIPREGITDAREIVLVGNEDCELGLLVDAVLGVFSIPPDSLQTFSSEAVGTPRSSYQKGVTPSGVVLLDSAKLLRDPQIEINDEVVL